MPSRTPTISTPPMPSTSGTRLSPPPPPSPLPPDPLADVGAVGGTVARAGGTVAVATALGVTVSDGEALESAPLPGAIVGEAVPASASVALGASVDLGTKLKGCGG